MPPLPKWTLFLPLVFFTCPPPSFAEPAWTTVWSPGGPPAARTTDSDSGSNTHDSAPKCAPCKVWDAYSKDWDPLPEGSEPIKCPGDTTDYDCKECDGAGNVRNKNDGAECDILMVVMEKGKCCDGECLPIPQPGIDPCAWALDNKNLMSPADKNKLQCGSRTMGYVLCIFGAKYACTVPCNFPSTWGPDMKNCIMQEENNHLGSTTAQCPPCIGMAKYPNVTAEKDEECTARAATFACMEGLKTGASRWYKQTIKDAQINIRQDMIDRGCPNIPPAP